MEQAMNGEILELIEEYGITNGPVSEYMATAFYRAAFNAGLEAAAKVCEDNCAGYSYGRETHGPCLTEFQKESGGRHDGMTYAKAIRTLKEKP